MQAVKYVPMLVIPSLNGDDFITVLNVTKDEAIELLTDYKARVEAKRKMGTTPTAVSDEVLEVLEGSNLNLVALVEDESLADLVKSLSQSEIRKARGRRAIFVDVENDTIGYGTTVIYNQNWAMNGVTDTSVMGAVLEAVAEAA